MGRQWTENQKNAINARGGSLIVSAAAGSGKTAVLVQRVIERITDSEKPCDADRLLVVTYTRAAAAAIVKNAAQIKEVMNNGKHFVFSSPDNSAY